MGNKCVVVLISVFVFTNYAMPAPPPEPPLGSIVVDSSANQYSMWGTSHECLGYYPPNGGLGFVNRDYAISGCLNLMETDSLFNFFIHDHNVYGQDFGPARNPSFCAMDAPLISFIYLIGGAYGGFAAIYQSGGWWSSAWDPPADLGPGEIGGYLFLGKQLSSGNRLFIGVTTDARIIYRTRSSDMQTPIAAGVVDSGYIYGSFDINGNYTYVYYYDSTMNVYHKTTTDGISWSPQEPDSIIWPQPYPNSVIQWLQMALTNEGNPILVFNVIDGDDPEWPPYGKIYVNVAPAETCIEVSSSFGMPDTECAYCTIASGSVSNDKVVVIYCTPRNNLPDSLCFWDIFYNYSTDNGLTWNTPANITSGDTINHCLPQLAKRLSGLTFYYAYGTCIAHNHYDLLWDCDQGGYAPPTRWYIGYNPVRGVTEYRAELPQELALSVTPNPFTRNLTVKFQIPNAKYQINAQSQISLQIFDASGRIVKSFNHSTIQPVNQIVWDGSDDMSRALPSGVYLVRLAVGPVGEADRLEKTEKVVLLR